MQNRYAGDVGDFGKFSLLRSLFNSENDRLGVIWYLFPDETHNDDGKYTKYIERQKFQSCDPELINKMSKVLDYGTRSVRALENNNILKSNTIYFSEKLDFHIKYPTQKKIEKETRLSKRHEWLKNAVQITKPCNIVFLDPDNGLEIDSCKNMNQIKSGKYAYYSEIDALFDGKDACIIYHHLNRHKKHGTHKEQIKTRVKALRYKINPTGKIFALRYKPYSPRAYFILSNKTIEVVLERRIQEFIENSCSALWDNYFEG